MELINNDLPTRLRKGEAEAWKTIEASLRRYLQPMCSGFIWERDLFEDCLQEALLKGYQEIGAFSGTSNGALLLWFRTTFTRACCDLQRWFVASKRDVRRTMSLCELKDDPLGQDVDAIDQATVKERQEGLDRCLAALGRCERDVLRKKYYEGLRLRDIATIMNIPYPIVQQWHIRGVNRLRFMLQDEARV